MTELHEFADKRQVENLGKYESLVEQALNEITEEEVLSRIWARRSDDGKHP
jgi:hypothetical protein